MSNILLVIRCFFFLLPAGVSNMAPVLLTKRFGFFLDTPVDFNRTFNGKPIFGKNKTWRGVVGGTVSGMLVYLLEQWLYQFPFFKRVSLIDYSSSPLLLGFLMSFGALLGDLVKSFFKRRVGIESGKPLFFFDQVDWILGAITLSLIVYVPSVKTVIVLTLLAVVLHPLVNYVGFILKQKSNKF